MASQSSRKQLNLTASREHARIALESARALGREPTFLAYEFGTVHVMMLQWAEGACLLERLLLQPGFRVRGTCALQIAGCYAMLGQFDKATEMWKRIPTLTGKSSSVDQYVLGWAARYLQNGGHFSLFEIVYILRNLAKMTSVLDQCLVLLNQQATAAGILNPDGSLVPAATSTHHAPEPTSAPAASPPPQQGKFAKGLKAFKSMATTAMKTVARKKDAGSLDFTNDGRAAYLLLKGAMLKYKRNLADEEAIACLNEIATMKDVLIEKWYVPYSYYELCESYFFMGKPEIAAAMLKKCISCKDFAWEDPLKMRIRVTADQLKRGPGSGEVLLTRSGAAAAATVDVDDDDGEPITQAAASPMQTRPPADGSAPPATGSPAPPASSPASSSTTTESPAPTTPLVEAASATTPQTVPAATPPPAPPPAPASAEQK